MTTIKQLDREKYLRENPKLIYNFAYGLTKCPEDSEDITIEVSMKFLRTSAVFEYNTDPKNYIYRMIVNQVINYQRSASKRPETAPWESEYDHLIEDINSIQPSISPITEEGSLALQALDQLDPRTKNLITRRVFNEDSYKELNQLPEFRGKTEGNIRSTVCRALKQVTKILITQGVIEKPKQKRKPAKLSYEKVLEIRANPDNKTKQELAEMYSISIQTVRRIISNKVRVND